MAWRAGGGFDHRDWNDLPGVRHHWWSFCQARDLPGPGVQRRIAPRHRAVILLKDTHDVTNYVFLNSRVVNRSLDVDRIRQAYGRDIPARRIADIPAAPAYHARQIERETLYAYRPRLREAPAGRTPQTIRRTRPDPTEAAMPAAPPVTARTPQAERIARDQQRREALDLERRQAADRKRVQQELGREIEQPPPGVRPEELQRRHAEVQRALEEQSARDQRVLRARLEQKQQDARKAPPGTTQPATRERKSREDRSR